MEVLIFGGTGAMGSHLITLITSLEGVNVTVTSRSRNDKTNSLEFVQGDAHQMDFLKKLLSLKKWDVIVDFMAYSTEEFRKRVDLLLESTKQYVYLSSARVYADNDKPIKESSPRILDICDDKDYLQTDEYALAKARQENLLFENKKRNWTIIRPYITFSEQRLQLSSAEKESWLFDALHDKPILFSRDLADKKTTLTYGYDVARGIAAIIGQEKALGEAFHITVNETHKWSEILETYVAIIKQKTGVSPTIKWFDEWNPLIGGGAMQVKWDRLYNRRFDNTKISGFIDVNSFKKTIPALSNCLSSFIERPCFRTIDWKVVAKKDRIEGKWTKLCNIEGTKQRIKYLLFRFGVLG